MSSSSDELAAGEKRILNIIGRNPDKAYTAHDFLRHGKGDIEETMDKSKAVLRRLDRLVELGLLKKQVVYMFPNQAPGAVNLSEPDETYVDAGEEADTITKNGTPDDGVKRTVRPRLELCPLCGNRCSLRSTKSMSQPGQIPNAATPRPRRTRERGGRRERRQAPAGLR